MARGRARPGASPDGTPFDRRAIPPSSASYEYHRYRVVTPLDGVEQGRIAPWFEQPGGGVKYTSPVGRDMQWYIDNGYLEELD